ncbi:unnamed protein product [Tilletia controversa]|uniref:Cutinase n=3 Tax=Tilletia TaxID=13289 RepID=A0A8X7MXF0_9BASI|nr:hypothetical protein CF336_g4899 [Tilletia laevis]KAE8194451.1 hypothetical protein CF328_g4744 [Tilletia controversa]KAE8255373.1 hypothetical protein A4X03_0g5578 [Tilletia caries]KAE8198493.1 hypothetical protein CF335_g4376 [Tilletia laevis]KAE8252727.1 hypothetical protein A4X06_0g1977 [Tilletia controversa]
MILTTSTLLAALVLPFLSPANAVPMQASDVDPTTAKAAGELATSPIPVHVPYHTIKHLKNPDRVDTSPIPVPGCHDYVILDSRGTGEPQGRSFQFAGMIKKTLAGLPGGISVSNPYPASWVGNSPAQGSAWLQNYLQQGVARCPEQKYAVLGISQGAVVTWNAIGDLGREDPVYQAIKAVIVEGDPYHVPKLSSNVDEYGGRQTVTSHGMMRYSYGNIAKYDIDRKMLDICYSGDFVCNDQGHHPMDHGKYGGTDGVQTMGAQFLISHLRG